MTERITQDQVERELRTCRTGSNRIGYISYLIRGVKAQEIQLDQPMVDRLSNLTIVLDKI